MERKRKCIQSLECVVAVSGQATKIKQELIGEGTH